MNRLASEKSPYLLQHKNNPVDWFPWGPEAFEKARREDKPIFLSIGYSTCHWCHVMEHESFEDSEVARVMNDTFVSIKVDREERPDIDHLYMTVCQMMTQSGGWPLTIVMTPDQKPFFAGTYFPKETKYGRVGLLELVAKLKDLWQKEKTKAVSSAEEITAFLKENFKGDAGDAISEDDLKQSIAHLKSGFDRENGGFGDAPKFPSPHNLMLLLRAWKRYGDTSSLKMVEQTLSAMRAGGMYDQVGFGFHRYSVDARWLVPHFEKMLYDQALLAMAYIEGFQATGREEFSQTAQEIFEYVLRDLTDPGGGFYSAEDADSEGEEGKFYVWSWDEIKTILGDEAKEAARIFNLVPEGNFTDMGHDSPFNIPHLHWSTSLRNRDEQDVLKAEKIRQKLFEVREKRVRPHLDDKILADWNGLMIAALAKGAQVLSDDDGRLLTAAKRAFDFVCLKMKTSDGRLFHRLRDGEAAITANIDDYAFMTWAALELYGATFETGYLKKALEFTDLIFENFWDTESGGCFFTSRDDEQLIFRKKEIYDGAVPSGNAVNFLNLLKLSRLTGQIKIMDVAKTMLQSFSSSIRAYPAGHNMTFLAFDFFLGPIAEVVVTGPSKGSEVRSTLQTLSFKFSPNRVLLFRPSDRADEITEIAPFTEPLVTKDNKPTIYVCRDFACQKPTNDLEHALTLF